MVATAVEIAQGEVILRQLATQVGLSGAMERLLVYRNQYRPTSNPNFWAIINFTLHSSEPRLYIFNQQVNVVERYLCAHGLGSEGVKDDGCAEIFSNDDGSNCSSLGIYRCADTYFGEHGKSLKLDGIEATNFNARARYIVMHGATYVSKKHIRRTGRIGRSLGCPAVEMAHIPKLPDQLRGGSLLIIFKD